MTDRPLEIALNDGRKVPVATCDCGACGNEWYVPSMSPEWRPDYCPYCGIKFDHDMTETTDMGPFPKEGE